MKRKVLGRGLSALIPDADPMASVASGIDIDQIQPNPHQPRFKLDERHIDELAASIRENGVLQPVLVRPLGDGYQLVAGERRLAAAQRAGMLKVPAFVRRVPEDKLLELALIENIQREQLNPLEEARAYQSLLDTLCTTQEKLAARLGKERSSVANSIRLLKLPPNVQGLVAEGSLSPGHARALLASNANAFEMLKVARTIISDSWSVRDAEKWARRRNQTKHTRKAQDPNVGAAADRLQRLLGTKVEITGGRGPRCTGQVRVHYYGSEDLNRIYHILVGNHAHQSEEIS